MFGDQRINDRRKYNIKAEINVIPLLDILLVLLIIFMMIPSMLTQGFEVNIPNNNRTKHTVLSKKPCITIEIIDKNLYNLIDDNQYINRIDQDQLLLKISAKTRINPDFFCLIAASENRTYSEIIQVLNLLNNAGISSIGMITNPIYSRKSIRHIYNNK